MRSWLFLMIVVAAQVSGVTPVYSAELGETGQLKRSLWFGLDGNDSLNRLWGRWGFLKPSTVTAATQGIGIPERRTSGYAQKIRAYLVPPMTGQYRFWLSAADDAALFIGTGKNKFSKVRQIHLAKRTERGVFGSHRRQASKLLFLKAGEPYYFEVQHGDSTGGGHLDLRWSCVEASKPAEGPRNWALSGKASQGPGTAMFDRHNLTADLAIDGNTVGHRYGWTSASTRAAKAPWWKVDLKESRSIDRIEIYRKDGKYQPKPSQRYDFRCTILGDSGEVLKTKEFKVSDSQEILYWEVGGIAGKEVRIDLLTGPKRHLILAEVRVLGRAHPETGYIPIQPIPAKYFRSYMGSPLDTDDDDLPDAWEKKNGFDLSKAEPARALADPDHDGFNAFEESRFDRSPEVPNSIEGHLTVEKWSRVSERGVGDFIHSDRFLAKPSRKRSLSLTSYRGLQPESGIRMRGYLTPPETGMYHLWVSSRHSSELWLSDNELIFRKKRIASISLHDGSTRFKMPSFNPERWDVYPNQKSQPVFLEAGKPYFLEALALHLRGSGSHLSIAWQRPGGKRELLPTQFVRSYHPDQRDLDGDALLDDWEKFQGLDPEDNGLQNREQEGEYGDFDQDGLTNFEEFTHGTNPCKSDTDGDGFSDHYELKGLLTDPLQLDKAQESLIAFSRRSKYRSISPWIASLKEDHLVPASFRGDLRHSVSLPKGAYRAVYTLDLKGQNSLREEVELELRINGESITRELVAFGTNHQGYFSIPVFLPQDNPTFSMISHNHLASRRVAFRSLQIFPHDPASLIPDQITTSPQSTEPLIFHSQTSPAFLEGHTSLGGTLDNQPLGQGHNRNHWFTDVDLDPVISTDFQLRFHSGQSHQGSVLWIGTNVFTQKEITIRKNDSLKLVSLLPDGLTRLEITPPKSPSVIETLSASDSGKIFKFTLSGIYQMAATHPSGQSGTLTIHVLHAEPEPTPRTLVVNSFGELRFDTAKMPTGLYVDAGPDLVLRQGEPVSKKFYNLHIAPRNIRGQSLLMRTSSGGPIIATQAINPVTVADNLQNSFHSAGPNQYFPGKVIYTAPFVVGDLGENDRVMLSIPGTRWTFTDGLQKKTLRAKDFQQGMAILHVLAPETLKGKQARPQFIFEVQCADGRMIGWR